MKTSIITTILCVLMVSLQAKIVTRGTLPGEIYLARIWYQDANWNAVYGVFRSLDHGRTLQLRYASTTMPEDTHWLFIFSDATPGVIYGATSNGKLYVSRDYARTWQYLEDFDLHESYAAGCAEGEIYKLKHRQLYQAPADLYRSTNYGTNFQIAVPIYGSIARIIEVGTEPNELYCLYELSYKRHVILYSNTNGVISTLQIELDTTYRDHSISRGAVAGELYLMNWDKQGNYHIHYSCDHGQTFTHKFVSEGLSLGQGRYVLTAGAEPGSVYVVRTTATFIPYFHGFFDVAHSSDYGETFTTYHHELDSNYFSNISSPIMHNNISVFPNPFDKTITVNTNEQIQLYIYNMQGKLCANKHIEHPGAEVELSNLPVGVYLYKAVFKDRTIKTGKLIKH